MKWIVAPIKCLYFNKEIKMTRLEDLLYSLATVIIRYHDVQSRVKKLVFETDKQLIRRDSRHLAKTIINDNQVDYKTKFEALVKECPPERKPFLTYVLNELVLIKLLLDRKTPFEPSQLEELKKQLFTLFSDFNKLLSTVKSRPCKITYSTSDFTPGSTHTLDGLVNDGWAGSELCNSGIFLNQEVLERFGVTLISSPEEIAEIAEQICVEQQNALLISEIKMNEGNLLPIPPQEEPSSTQEMEKKNEQLVAQLSKLKIAFYLLTTHYMKLSSQDEQLQKTLSQCKERMAKDGRTITRHEETIEMLSQQIKDLSNASDSESTVSYGSFFGVKL